VPGPGRGRTARRPVEPPGLALPGLARHPAQGAPPRLWCATPPMWSGAGPGTGWPAAPRPQPGATVARLSCPAHDL